MKYVKNSQASIENQRGVILLVALVTLLVMTMVGLTSIGNATLQERMAANNRFYLQARLNAETALRFAEDYLSGRNVVDVNGDVIASPAVATNEEVHETFTSADDDFLYLSVHAASGKSDELLTSYSDDNDLSEKTAWAASNSLKVSVTDGEDPSEVIIEFIGTGSPTTEVDLSKYEAVPSSFGTKPYLFRITAIGYSSNDPIYSVVESIYATEL